MNEANLDPWIVQAAKQQAQVPNGFYKSKFMGVEDFSMPQDGSLKWRFTWEILTGEHKGELASALTDRSINPNTLPERLISGLLGRAIVAGENVKAAAEAAVGKTYMVNVQPGPQGGKPGVKSVGLPPHDVVKPEAGAFSAKAKGGSYKPPPFSLQYQVHWGVRHFCRRRR
jgi:hypothetical protein